MKFDPNIENQIDKLTRHAKFVLTEGEYDGRPLTPTQAVATALEAAGLGRWVHEWVREMLTSIIVARLTSRARRARKPEVAA